MSLATEHPPIAERPTEVIDLRRELVEFWKHKGSLQYAMTRQGRRGVGNQEVEAERGRAWMETTLRNGAMYWVSPDMVDVINAYAARVPDCYPLPPVPEALVVFAKPVVGTDAANGRQIHTAAYLWGYVQAVGVPCWEIETFGWRAAMRPPDLEDDNLVETWRSMMPTKLVMTGGSEWPRESQSSDFSLLPAADPVMEESMLEDRRLMSTFWALCSQRITIETLDHGDRASWRRSNRAGIPPKSVRVINLREPDRKGRSGEGGGGVEYSHRWMVGLETGGFWRNQPYGPRAAFRRPQLILPYVAGPKDKPLVIRETVRALKR